MIPNPLWAYKWIAIALAMPAIIAWVMQQHNERTDRMIALSIRQPWAWLILHGGKDIENRTWPTKVRGRVLVHAGKGMTRNEWGDAWEFAHGSGAGPKGVDAGLTFDNIQRGGIVGSVEIVDCVNRSNSRWFVGDYGFVLRDPQVLPFTPFKGALGFFDVPRTALVALAA